MQTLLDAYSPQELVLLEFLTHAPDIAVHDIEEILMKYPPGFTASCRCTTIDAEDIEELCDVCQLADAYMDYSFERCRGAAEMTM